MTIGPVELLVLGFDHPRFEGDVVTELQRLREDGLVRVIDALAVYKDATGRVTGLKGSQLSGGETAEFGTVVGTLVGLGAEAEEVGTIEERLAEEPGVFGEAAWDVLAEVPEDSAAALVLLEHRWAIPLRDAVSRAGGFRLASEFISPLDLVSLGLVSVTDMP